MKQIIGMSMGTDIYVLEKSILNDLMYLEAHFENASFMESEDVGNKQESVFRKLVNKLKELIDKFIGMFKKDDAAKRLEKLAKENPNAKFEMSFDPEESIKACEKAAKAAKNLESEKDPERVKTLSEKIKDELNSDLDKARYGTGQSKIVAIGSVLGAMKTAGTVTRLVEMTALRSKRRVIINDNGTALTTHGFVGDTLLVGLWVAVTAKSMGILNGIFTKALSDKAAKKSESNK